MLNTQTNVNPVANDGVISPKDYLVQTSAGIQFYMEAWFDDSDSPEQREDQRSCPSQA